MGALKFAFGANYKRFYNNIKDIAKNEDKSTFSMFCDAVFCAIALGSGLSDYLNYEFYKKPFKEKKEYATIRNQDNFYAIVSPAEFKKTFTVKPTFMKVFSDYTKRKFLLPSESSVEELSSFLKANPCFIEKPLDGLGGYGVAKKYAKDIESPESYFSYLLNNRLFIEELIIQHEKMSALCEKSVNTIRIMTSSTSGVPKIFFAGLRVGNGSRDVDNFHSGGMGILVDEETGVLIGQGIDKDLNHFSCHPVTKVKFDGYQLPFWDEIKKMVLEASLIEPRIMVIGWDVAITPDGPVFVEANRRPGFDMPQVLYKRGRKDLITAALSELKARNK